MSLDKEAQAKAEAKFKAKQEQLLDAPRARIEYEAARSAVIDRTAKLRAERLRRQAAEQANPPIAAKAAAKAEKPRRAARS